MFKYHTEQDVDKATEVVYASSGAAHNGVYGSYTSLIRCPAIQVSIKPFNGPPGTHELPTKFYQVAIIYSITVVQT